MVQVCISIDGVDGSRMWIGRILYRGGVGSWCIEREISGCGPKAPRATHSMRKLASSKTKGIIGEIKSLAIY